MYCLWLKTFRRTLEKLGLKRTLWASTISHFFGYGKCHLDSQPTNFMYFLAKAISESQVRIKRTLYLLIVYPQRNRTKGGTTEKSMLSWLKCCLSESQGSNVLCMYLPSTLNLIGPKGGEGDKRKANASIRWWSKSSLACILASQWIIHIWFVCTAKQSYAFY